MFGIQPSRSRDMFLRKLLWSFVMSAACANDPATVVELEPSLDPAGTRAGSPEGGLVGQPGSTGAGAGEPSDASRLAATCGQTGGACCRDGSCSGDACCLGHICRAPGTTCDSGRGTCKSGSCDSCGRPGERCCADLQGWSCGRGSVVRAGPSGSCTCAKCGDPGEPACADDRCNGNHCNVDGTCVAEGGSCRDLGTCVAGRCNGCGALNQPCCRPGALKTCADPGTICSSFSSRCVSCGFPGAPCCSVRNCPGGCCTGIRDGICVEAGSSCGVDEGTCQANGSCGICGGAGQPCCPWKPTASQLMRCSAPNTTCDFARNVCQPCGQSGQPCCFTPTGRVSGPSIEGICLGAELACQGTSGYFRSWCAPL